MFVKLSLFHIILMFFFFFKFVLFSFFFFGFGVFVIFPLFDLLLFRMCLSTKETLVGRHKSVIFGSLMVSFSLIFPPFPPLTYLFNQKKKKKKKKKK